MNTARKKRLLLIGFLISGVAIATWFALYAFNQNLMFYFSPSDVEAGKAPLNKTFRLGGMVVKDSINKAEDSLTIQFALTDYAKTVNVTYTGILPDLFREGQGLITKGKLRSDGKFEAEEVLAKHDENYMPPEVAESLKIKETAADKTKHN